MRDGDLERGSSGSPQPTSISNIRSEEDSPIDAAQPAPMLTEVQIPMTNPLIDRREKIGRQSKEKKNVS